MKRIRPRILQIADNERRLEGIGPSPAARARHRNHHRPGGDPHGQPEVPPLSTIIVRGHLCPILPHRTHRIGRAGGLDHQHPGGGYIEGEVIHVVSGMELPSRGRGTSRVHGDGGRLGRRVAVVVPAGATATTATAAATAGATAATTIPVLRGRGRHDSTGVRPARPGDGHGVGLRRGGILGGDPPLDDGLTDREGHLVDGLLCVGVRNPRVMGVEVGDAGTRVGGRRLDGDRVYRVSHGRRVAPRSKNLKHLPSPVLLPFTRS